MFSWQKTLGSLAAATSRAGASGTIARLPLVTCPGSGALAAPGRVWSASEPQDLRRAVSGSESRAGYPKCGFVRSRAFAASVSSARSFSPKHFGLFRAPCNRRGGNAPAYRFGTSGDLLVFVNCGSGCSLSMFGWSLVGARVRRRPSSRTCTAPATGRANTAPHPPASVPKRAANAREGINRIVWRWKARPGFGRPRGTVSAAAASSGGVSSAKSVPASRASPTSGDDGALPFAQPVARDVSAPATSRHQIAVANKRCSAQRSPKFPIRCEASEPSEIFR
jgi:hypothetical protein